MQFMSLVIGHPLLPFFSDWRQFHFGFQSHLYLIFWVWQVLQLVFSPFYSDHQHYDLTKSDFQSALQEKTFHLIHYQQHYFSYSYQGQVVCYNLMPFKLGIVCVFMLCCHCHLARLFVCFILVGCRFSDCLHFYVLLYHFNTDAIYYRWDH